MIESHALIEGFMLLVDSRLTVDRDVNGILIRYQPKVLMKCQLNIDRLLIECADQEYLSRVLIIKFSTADAFSTKDPENWYFLYL